MTKVRITGLEQETKRLTLRISSAIARSKFNEDMQKDVVDQIRNNGLREPLKTKTIKQRQRLEKYNVTHPKYKAAKSSLTFTGELLDAIRVEFVTSKITFVFDALKKKHKKLKTKKDKTVKGKSISNRDLLIKQNESREILQVFDDSSFKSKIERKLISAIKRFFK